MIQIVLSTKTPKIKQVNYNRVIVDGVRQTYNPSKPTIGPVYVQFNTLETSDDTSPLLTIKINKIVHEKK